jgi:glycosyltransferase involved in cell wall biosynthesis
MLVVVDASDDHPATRQVVEEAVARSRKSLSVKILRSEPGISRQRNVGLRHVESPVVLFPDDDALWFPDFAESVMRVYERDEEGLIGAVGGVESRIPPDGLLPGVKAPSDGLNVHIPRFVEQTLDLFERRFFPDPFFSEARVCGVCRSAPAWLEQEDASGAHTITGFRMSFRTDLIKRIGFDEVLGRYALFEDHDACMGVLASHCIVTANRARVFHHRLPQQRADGVELGVMHVLNRAYILSKHAPAASSVRSALTRFAYYKLFRYLMRAYAPAMRKRLTGAWRATRRISVLCNTPRQDLAEQYLKFRKECLDPSGLL